MNKGYSAIACHNIKFASNAGSVLRAAGCYDSDLVLFHGDRIPKNQMRTDTRKTYKNVPTIWTNDIIEQKPLGCKMVAIEIVDKAVPLFDFVHPESALYLFGGEDESIPKRLLNQCVHKVYIPTAHCMNLSATVNVVLYDRAMKMKKYLQTQPNFKYN